MYLRWTRRQLKSNRQTGEILCPHSEILRPWTVFPNIVHQVEGRSVTAWNPGPTIRECCIDRGQGLAIAAWWWEVRNRFKDLNEVGLEDPVITEALLEQLDLIEEMLEDMVPKPSVADWNRYLEYREDIGRTTRRIQTPRCLRQLGLVWPCSKETLAQRWKEIALKTHPDHGGDAAIFRAYFAAYRDARKIVDRLSA